MRDTVNQSELTFESKDQTVALSAAMPWEQAYKGFENNLSRKIVLVGTGRR